MRRREESVLSESARIELETDVAARGWGSSMESPTFFDALFNKFLPSNNEDDEAWSVVHMYGCD